MGLRPSSLPIVLAGSFLVVSFLVLPTLQIQSTNPFSLLWTLVPTVIAGVLILIVEVPPHVRQRSLRRLVRDLSPQFPDAVITPVFVEPGAQRVVLIASQDRFRLVGVGGVLMDIPWDEVVSVGETFEATWPNRRILITLASESLQAIPLNRGCVHPVRSRRFQGLTSTLQEYLSGTGPVRARG